MLIFECFRCEQVIPNEEEYHAEETDTDLTIVCMDCYKKETKRTIMDRLIGEYLKENYKITKQNHDEHKTLGSMELCKEHFISDNPYNQMIWTNRVVKFITGTDNYKISGRQTPFQHANNLHPTDTRRTENVLNINIWCSEKSEEWGVENPTTEMTKEEWCESWDAWFDKWKIGKMKWNMKDMFEWLEEEDFCLK